MTKKEMAIKFVAYVDRFRVEDNRWFKKECDRLGGMFTYYNGSTEQIYNDFINRVPIKSQMTPDGFPDVFYTVDEKYNLIDPRNNHLQGV